MLHLSCATSPEDHEQGSVSIVDEQAAKHHAGGSSSDLSGNDDKEILCPVCFQMLKDPFLTTCGHSFCYSCIQRHLSKKNDCPSCLEHLSSVSMYPNILLDKVLRKLAALQALDRASPVEHLHLYFQNGEDLSVKDIDTMLDLLAEKKIKAQNREDEENMELLFQFLQYWLDRKQTDLQEVEGDLKGLEQDLTSLKVERGELLAVKKSYLSRFSTKPKRPATSYTRDEYQSPTRKKQQLIDNQYEAVQACYLRHCRRFQDAESPHSRPSCTGLDDFRSAVRGFTRYSQVRVLGETRTGHAYSPNIISSIEFDRDDEFFATAGVSGSLKIFNYSVIRNNSWEAAVDIKTRTKLSCISWDNYAKNLVASSDYDGIIHIWDISSCQSVAEFEEHERRAWSVDFSPFEPSMLLSGSDDGKVKVWCKGHRASVSTIEVKANICSVKYNPSSNHLIAAGSADHCIYYYDLRQTSSPVHVFSEHEKAVSYVKFISADEMVSASTDGTLRLWNMDEKSNVEILRGHTNERNFVGLAVNKEYIACGSESNEVFIYYKSISKPGICHKYPTDAEASDAPFISAICWKREGFVFLAANSQGTIRALMLIP